MRTLIIALTFIASLSFGATTNIVQGIAFVTSGTNEELTTVLNTLSVGDPADSNEIRLAEVGRNAVVEAVNKLIEDYNEAVLQAAIEATQESVTSSRLVIVVE